MGGEGARARGTNALRTPAPALPLLHLLVQEEVLKWFAVGTSLFELRRGICCVL